MVITFNSEGESLEFQVLTLQEQLFTSLIENHNLADQVKKLRLLVGASEDLSDQLERERERNKILSERIGEYENNRRKVFSEQEYENNRRKVFSEQEHERNVSSKIPRSPVRGRFGWRKRGLSKSKSLDQSEFMSFNSDEDEKEVAHEKGRRPSMPLSGEISDDTSSTPVKEEPLTVKNY
ncbi:hypothetical protein Anas_03850 [Armadillidium nasatum]|uniref:Uncharacterized protein n=1 Tax=Armadillidium nasatum TaxID=96803 RepID=A0A5N5SRX3_9CRUS|nr:hypothetical protein Anas_03850 [Armadillidium nasatum]